MSKKDYILLAKALKDSKPEDIAKFFESSTPTANWAKGVMDSWKNTVKELADALQSNNPHFNRAKFLTACGYNE